jgi:hypothetical protein
MNFQTLMAEIPNNGKNPDTVMFCGYSDSTSSLLYKIMELFCDNINKTR